MYGAVIGNMVGARFENRRRPWSDLKTKDFWFWHPWCHFADDTVCTVAVADILMNDLDPARGMQSWCRDYPRRGYGRWFDRWIYSESPAPYRSYGNGAGMRVSPCALLNRDDLDAALSASDRVTGVTHDHPEGMKGARAVTHSVWLALNGASPGEIRRTVGDEYGYDMDRSVDDIRPSYDWDETCQGSVPESIICAIESDHFEDAVRNAVSIGGDSGTIGAMTGAVAEALHGFEDRFGCEDRHLGEVRSRLDGRMMAVLDDMYSMVGMTGPAR